ncbi:hypothetical protein HY065_00935 [Candidatus Berkelbacteria bacterium]|nr:hypothetical protein [Candidatus Berkelbacteria bacterium]
MLCQNPDFSGLPEIALLNNVEPTRDYPPSFERLSDWSKQLNILHNVVFKRKLNPEQVKEHAEQYLARTEIWERTFVFMGSAKRVFDGLLVFANPFAVAHKLQLGDLAEDLSKAINGRGLWGVLCETILFPVLTEATSGFVNYRAQAMGSDRFLPLKPVAQWLWQAYQTEGDFVCRPCSVGRCMAGYAVESSRSEVSHYDGIVMTMPMATTVRFSSSGSD